MPFAVAQPDPDGVAVGAHRHHLAVALRAALLRRAMLGVGFIGRDACPHALDFDFARRLL